MDSNSIGGSLECIVTTETFKSTGETLNKVTIKNGFVLLGRNELRQLILQVTGPSSKHIYLIPNNIQIFKKFSKDGKATINFPEKGTRIMMNNAPPDQLRMLLKKLSVKLSMSNVSISARVQLTSNKPRLFEEISPMSAKEVLELYESRAKTIDREMTPKSKMAIKRSFMGNESKFDINKENMDPNKPALKRTLIAPSLQRNPVLISLTEEQKLVLVAVRKGVNIFFTGSAGTGKSFLLRRIVGTLPPNHTFTTASTGAAACHINGITLHSFAGIGSGNGSWQHCFELAQRQNIKAQWLKCRHLIIDEISMVDAEFFDKLDYVAKAIRKRNEPFGGIQLILSGDFFQLPPVTTPGKSKQFAFQAKCWSDCIDKTFVLKDVKRQTDAKFIKILNQVRLGNCSESLVKVLEETKNQIIEKHGVKATRLCTHRDDVEFLNHAQLQKLSGEKKIFNATDSHSSHQRYLNNLCPVPQSIELRVGAQVMLVKNHDVGLGLVNGARGVVVAMEKSGPKVLFANGRIAVIVPDRWSFGGEIGGDSISRKALPLKLAWAISVHKSQGMTLDCVELSLSRVFECGQAYVALSRAKSLSSLRVIDFTARSIRAHPEVLNFYRNMQKEL